MSAQGISEAELPYSAPWQPYLAHVAIWFSSFIMLSGGFYVFVSFLHFVYILGESGREFLGLIGRLQVDGHWDVSDFFSSYFTIPLCLVLYFGWKMFKKTNIVPLSEVPVTTFVAIAKANPEPPFRKKKGIIGWFGSFCWD
jgi:yeast amino acid transporter